MSETIKAVKQLGFPWETQDPFLFCVHHADSYPEGNDQLGPATSLEGRAIGNDFTIKDGWRMYHGETVPGFPAHPHRGFETITIVLEGLVDHADSMGASGRFGNGDVQWMTAGAGVQHSEMFPLLKSNEPNPLELFQIWLNLPASKKYAEPHFKMLWSETIPVLTEKDQNDNSIEVIVVAGKYHDTTAPAPAPESWASIEENDVAIYRIKLDPNAKWVLPRAKNPVVNRSLYFFKGGSINIASTDFTQHLALELEATDDVQIENGNGVSELLLLQGNPINEPVAKYGPFVMNTHEEIQQAFSDYQRTQYGGWPWENNDQTHPRDRGRFAKHADGTLEEK